MGPNFRSIVRKRAAKARGSCREVRPSRRDRPPLPARGPGGRTRPSCSRTRLPPASRSGRRRRPRTQGQLSRAPLRHARPRPQRHARSGRGGLHDRSARRRCGRAQIKALGLGRVHLCGLSIGGMLGQRLAAQSPDLLASLILCDTPQTMSREVWDERLATIRKSRASGGDGCREAGGRWFTKPFRESARPIRCKASTKWCGGPRPKVSSAAARPSATLGLRPDGPRITCPSGSVLVGEEDPATPVAPRHARSTRR